SPPLRDDSLTDFRQPGTGQAKGPDRMNAAKPSVAVFLGSSSLAPATHLTQARRLGRWLAEQEIRLVYGGARVGPMGALADGALEAGGAVTGVFPEVLG